MAASSSTGSSTASAQGLSASTPAIVRLYIDHALNATGLPLDADTVLEVADGAAAGNVSRVVRTLSNAFDLPVWGREALVALAGAATGSTASPGGLASLFTSETAATVLGDVLSEYNMSAYLEAALLVPRYDAALASGNVTELAVVIVESAYVAEGLTNSGRRLSSSVDAEKLGVALGRVALAASTAAQLQRALREQDIVLAVRALVVASGYQDAPLGQAIVAVATAASVPSQLSSASTIMDLAKVMRSAMVAVPLDARYAAMLSDMIVVPL